MYIEQLYTGCLAEAAYYIESNGEAAIVDPLRETTPYLELAEKRGATIKYVLETHFHADFVSGHLDLAQETGAKIVYGPGANANFDLYMARDNEQLPLGATSITVLHTPGHTQESSCFLLKDATGQPHAIFTGDTLFIGDVGRPDLAVKSNLTERDLAGMLYDSLHNKVMALPDTVIVYPGHGAGSQCGKNMSPETVSTIGEQRRLNYALQPMSKTQFVDVLLDGLTIPPQYFPKNAIINKTGYEAIDEVMARNLQPLTVGNFETAAEEAIIIDSRSYDEFAAGFIPRSINIPLDGGFAVWVGTLIEDLKAPIVLVTPEGREEETILRMARVGYEHVQGYLQGGFAAWAAKHTPRTIIQRAPEAYNPDEILLDVRRVIEFEAEHVTGAVHIPLAELPQRLGELDSESAIQVTCQSGYRAMIAVSLLHFTGFEHVSHITGGMKMLRETDVPLAQKASALS